MRKFLLLMGLALACQGYMDDTCEACFDGGTYKCGTNDTMPCSCHVSFTEITCKRQEKFFATLIRRYNMHLHPSTSTSSLWIFGYGSLIWNPGFSYAERRKAHARGYARRMYQGNTYHRGDDTLPGRVATLVESESEDANGVVFRVEGTSAIEQALKHLNEREVGNGYVFKLVRVALDLSESASRASSTDGSSLSDSEEDERREGPDYHSSFLALTCIAHSSNELFLGPAHPQEMANQIGAASGKAGPNHEYVLKLAENIRALFPLTYDSHLFGLEKRVREIVKRERRDTV